jgi:nucleotide-binding universal stress UspA family protein
MRLLVPLDLSPATPPTLDAAARLARATGASLWLLHVAEPEPDFVGWQAGSDSVRGQLAREMRREHRELQAHAEALRASGLDATALLLQGPVAQTILAEAKRLGAETIVMASHGHGAMFDLLVGSICQAVLRASEVPVLLVPVRG